MGRAGGDEGPVVGVPTVPIGSPERMSIYADVAARPREAGFATTATAVRRSLRRAGEIARSEGKAPGYDRCAGT